MQSLMDDSEEVQAPFHLHAATKAGIELNLSTLINRAHLLIQSHRLILADPLLGAALKQAAKVNNDVLIARVCFWVGIIADWEGKKLRAEKAFYAALPCIGYSIEGDHMKQYVERYKPGILSLLSKKALLHRDQREWSTQLDALVEGEDQLFEASPASYLMYPPNEIFPHHNQQPSLFQPSTTHYSRDHEDAENMLKELVGELSDIDSHIFQHEVKKGYERLTSSTRTTPSPITTSKASAVPTSLPQQGLMKPLPTPTGEPRLSFLDKNSTALDRPKISRIESETDATEMINEITEKGDESMQGLERTNSRKDSRSSSFLRFLSKRLTKPLDTSKQEQTSEPEMPSPLRETSLPGGESDHSGSNSD